MKKHLAAFLLLLVICAFFISAIAIPAGIVLFIFDPSMFYVLIVAVAIVIVAACSFVMKKKPWFGELIEESGQRIPPLPPA